MQFVFVLEAVHGESPCRSFWAPARAQAMRLLLQLASESLLPIEAVVSSTKATFTWVACPDIMVAVDVAIRFNDFAELIPSSERARMK